MARGTLTRVADIIRADIDDLVSRMEDPTKLVRQMILEMEDAVDEAVASVGNAIANERLLERRIRDRKGEAEIWEEKAAQALDAGEEDLARRALERKVTIQATTEEMESALEEAGQITSQLKQQLVQFRQKLEEARTRQRSLAARHRIAQDPGRLTGRPMSPSTEAFDRYDRLCQEVERREAAAEVYEEVAGSAPGLEADFAKLEQKKRVQRELQTLKDRQGHAEA